MSVGTDVVNVPAGVYLVSFTAISDATTTLSVYQDGVAVANQVITGSSDTLSRTMLLRFTDAGTISVVNTGENPTVLSDVGLVVVKIQ